MLYQYTWTRYFKVEMHLTSQWHIYYVLTEVKNISQRNSSKQFQRMLDETVRKWQGVYEVFLLVSAF